MKLVIGYFYKKLLNLYGDNGNVEIFEYRCKARGFDVEVKEIELGVLQPNDVKEINLVFMGGGPDSSQKQMYQDLVENKKNFLKDYIETGGVGLFICGSYQLMGNYYKADENNILKGLGIFDLYTEDFGKQKPRCVGNTFAKISDLLLNDDTFKENNVVGNTLVGFENHGGRTFLENGIKPLAHVIKGFGNNGDDKTEGAIYNNCIGTYFHGPFLSKNSHICDYLIAKSLDLKKLESLDDSLIISAHKSAQKLKQ